MLRKVVFSICIIMSFISTKSMAGEPWNGVYFGVNASGLLASAATTEYYGPWDFGEYSLTNTAYSSGGQIGINFQKNSTVLGLEADFNYASLDLQRDFDDSYINNTAWNWYSTVRAKAGLANDWTLVYVTGGVAFVDVEQKFGDSSAPDEVVSNTGIKLGFTGGAGVEFFATDKFSLKTEYLYIGLPSATVKNDDINMDFVSSTHIFRVGLNYNLNGY